MAISFITPHNIVRDKVKAKKKTVRGEKRLWPKANPAISPSTLTVRIIGNPFVQSVATRRMAPVTRAASRSATAVQSNQRRA